MVIIGNADQLAHRQVALKLLPRGVGGRLSLLRHRRLHDALVKCHILQVNGEHLGFG